MDARGQVTQERAQAGKGWVLDRSYEQHTGRLTGILARAGTRSLSEGTLQHHLYGYDDLGNVTWREANLGPGHGFREDFSYDALQRLTGSQVLVQGIPSSESISYDSTGNITWRSGKGGYLYSRSHDQSCASSVAPGPHAVTAVDGMVLCYDANGNALRRGATQFVYDASNRVRTARDAAKNTKVGFDYGPGGERIRRLDYFDFKSTSPRIITHEIGSAQIRYSGVINPANPRPDEVRRSTGHTLIVQSRQGTGYRLHRQILLTDAQGSTQTVLGALTLEPVNGAMPTGFDAWGLRRTVAATSLTPTLWTLPFQLDLEHSTTRGYTGHEMAESVGIIHMRGRIYDPALGRFLQADPFVQSPGNSQSWNRYTYVFNNPLVYTDPSGYISVGDALRTIGAVVIMYYAPYLAPYLGGSTTAAMIVGGAAAGAVQTGTLRGAVIGGVSAGVFHSMGSYFSDVRGTMFQNASTGTVAAARTLSHGAAGGIMASLQGGKFGHGFASSGFTAVATPGLQRISDGPVRVTMQAAVGGTASSLAGGKFANGAVTAAMSYGFGRARSHGGSPKNGPDGPPDANSEAPRAFPVFAAEVNLSRAKDVFRVLHLNGEFDGIRELDFLDGYAAGSDNWRFAVRYIDHSPYYEGWGYIGATANIHWGGIDVYRGGASSPRAALMMVVHEMMHFDPGNIVLWKTDRQWGLSHSAVFRQVEVEVASIARNNWWKYAEQHGEWP